MSDLISNQIYLSRDAIREQITSYVKSYLELENVDLTKSSFLSFIINVISTLTANLMFYQTSTYKEFFLTKSQLPESIFNLAAFLGYSPSNASYSTANLLVKIPLTFSSYPTIFKIGDRSNPLDYRDFKFYAGDIEFTTYYSCTVTVTSGSSISIEVIEGTKKYNLPVYIEDDYFSFVIPVRQYKPIIQEFQIDSDLQLYQFVTIEMPFDGKLSTIEVKTINPGDAAETTWTKFNSLYLMSSTDKGYVVRRTDSGVKVYFGNGLIGVQPTPGCTVEVTTDVTEGADGNVIAGSIKKGDRIYDTSGKIVSYIVTNSSPAINGKDEESVEETRKNAIDSLTTLGRLVTENDFEDIDVVMADSPLASNSIPILKRSDIKVNDIQLFTTLLFESSSYENDTVLARNAFHTVPIETLYLPRATTIQIDSEDYYTLFDLNIELINSVAYYHYIMYEIEQIPTLITSYTSSYNIYCDNFTVSKSGSQATFSLHYHSTESNPDQCTCQMQVKSTELTYDMVNDGTANFVYTFSDYLDIPEESDTYYFTIKDPSEEAISQYSVIFVFRQQLKNFMMSNTYSDSTSTIIYDIPVIKKSYYDNINQRDFETQILQVMMSSMNMSNYKMITDFVNVKFTNTTGIGINMDYNKTTKSSVLDIISTPPISPSLNSRYIINKDPTGSFANYKDYIAQCTDATAITWNYILPNTEDILNVTSKNKKYIYTEEGWIPIVNYSIPLEIELDVFKASTYTGTLSDLSSSIKSAMLTYFQPRFGANNPIYRSEIINIVQDVEGVDHCRIRSPDSSIFFNFELTDLTEDQLLKYTPDYIYFNEENITIRIIV